MFSTSRARVSGLISSCCLGQSRLFCWEKERIEAKVVNNDDKNYDRAKVTEELYHRFSRRGLWRLRIRRFIRGFAWILVVQLTFRRQKVPGLPFVAFFVTHTVADPGPDILYSGIIPQADPPVGPMVRYLQRVFICAPGWFYGSDVDRSSLNKASCFDQYP